MKNLTFNGKSIKSITTLGNGNSMLINGHLIKANSKNECIEEFENNLAKYENRIKNDVQYFVSI